MRAFRHLSVGPVRPVADIASATGSNAGRRWRLPKVLLGGLALAACTMSVVVMTPQDEAAAEAFVAETLAAQYPDYPQPEAAATCVRENATDREVLLLAGTVGTGQADPRRRLGVLIAQRPETQACFQSKNLPRLR